jgi:lactate dehydrogenase-like 2-hydroxyacid dehydrogenase
VRPSAEDVRRKPEFLENENVALMHETRSATDETRPAMGDLVIDNCLAYLAGQPPLTPVS